MQDKLTPRQVRAWSLCALSVPAAMALPGCGWLWVLGGSILACALAACQQAMQRHSGLCMRQAFACAFGAVGGRIMAAAELLWLLFAASGAAAASQIAFEDDLGPFLPAIPLLLAALAGQKGRLAAGRVCAVLALCLAGLYTVIAAASLRHVQVDWSRPQGVPADAALAFCLCLGPVCMAFVTAEEETPRISPGTAAASALLPAVPAFLTAACLSPELARKNNTDCHLAAAVSHADEKPVCAVSHAAVRAAAVSRAAFGAVHAACDAGVRGRQHDGYDEAKKGRRACERRVLPAGIRRELLCIPASDLALGCRSSYILGIVPVLTQVIVNIKKTEK